MNYRILFVHGNSDNIAGQELSLLDRIQGLKKAGVYSQVVVPEPGIFADLLKEKGVDVTFMKLSRLTKKTPLQYLGTIRALSRLIRENGISLVHCSGVYPTQYSLPAARLAGVPCVTHVLSTVYTPDELKKSFLKYTDRVIGVSRAVSGAIASSMPIRRERLITVYCSVLNDDRDKDAGIDISRESLGISPLTKVISQIGQIIQRKGWESFILMARRVKDGYPDTVFLAVGDVPPGNEEYYRGLQELTKTLGLTADIRFLGFQKNIEAIFDVTDVSVLASLAEGLPRVVIQAMAAGKPVVATAVSGTPEAITDQETGILVPPEDPQAMAEAVLDLLHNNEKARRIAENGRKFVRATFSLEEHTKTLLGIYSSLLGKKKP